MDQILLGKKMLIAEDEPSMLIALMDKFKREGCVVIPAPDGEIALNLTIKEKPDVILLDLLMPKMSGMEVLNRIRKSSEWGKEVPIIILTNLPEDDKTMGGIAENKPSAYLVKSDWKLYEVIEKVRDCLQKPEGHLS